MTEEELFKLDYEQTAEYIHQLSDIRFKLLALLPIATGAALILAEPSKEHFTGILIGALGFFVTVGIIFYDQRNTEIYEKQIRRAKLLEIKLNFPPVSEKENLGGPFIGRPGRGRKLFGKIRMWHDRGLAIIYSVSLGVWVYLFVASILMLLPKVSPLVPQITGSAFALISALVTCIQLHKLDKNKSEEFKSLDSEIKQLKNNKVT